MKRVVLKDIIEKPISGEWGGEGGNVKVLRTTNFTNLGYVNYQNVVIRDIEQKKIDSKRLFRCDIIIEKSGGSPSQPVGRVVYFDSDEIFLCNNFTAILRPKQEFVFPKYLHYILFVSHQFGHTSAFQNKTTGIINLQLVKYIDQLQIPLPPLEQQKKIAAILDAADAYRQKTKALIVKYDELTQSLFLDMFGDPVKNEKGWEKKEIKEYILDVKNGITRRPKSEEDNSGDKVLKLKHIRSNYINYDCENRIMLEESEKQKFVVEIGDLLFIRVNGNPDYVGRCALHNDINQEVYYNDHIMRVRYNFNYYNGLFLSQYLNYPYGQSEISKQIKTSAGQHTINQGGLEKLNLIIPPIQLQNKFAERVQAIEVQKAQAQVSLEKAEELFNSLLQRAFKGEIH